MMRKNSWNSRFSSGAGRPFAGAYRPMHALVGLAFGCALFATGCGSKEQDRNLNPQEVGMTATVAPIFSNDETTLYEVKRGFQFPILKPDKDSQSALNQQKVEPYGRMPWITADDVKVQVTWTLSNLDDQAHAVEVLIDPWNEFGRYYPGMQLADAAEQKFEPNLSGIDQYFVLEGKSAGDASRRHGTFTFDDLHEMAVDFATVQNMIKNPPAALPDGFASKDMGMDDPLPVYANHAFNLQNHSWNDLLIQPYIPSVIPGLTGIDFGFRTSDSVMCPPGVTGSGANMACADTVALEISVEIVDTGKDRVQQEGDNQPLLAPTKTVVTVGTAVPTASPAAM